MAYNETLWPLPQAHSIGSGLCAVAAGRSRSSTPFTSRSARHGPEVPGGEIGCATGGGTGFAGGGGWWRDSAEIVNHLAILQ
jgi:hypothetical protein